MQLPVHVPVGLVVGWVQEPKDCKYEEVLKKGDTLQLWVGIRGLLQGTSSLTV